MGALVEVLIVHADLVFACTQRNQTIHEAHKAPLDSKVDRIMNCESLLLNLGWVGLLQIQKCSTQLCQGSSTRV